MVWRGVVCGVAWCSVVWCGVVVCVGVLTVALDRQTVDRRAGVPDRHQVELRALQRFMSIRHLEGGGGGGAYGQWSDNLFAAGTNRSMGDIYIGFAALGVPVRDYVARVAWVGWGNRGPRECCLALVTCSHPR